MIAAYFLNTLYKSKTWLFKIFPLLIGVGVFSFFALDTFSEKITKKLNERMYEDTRTGLFDQFFLI